jgi:glycosyltransferase involved in cell wall biosynthesis
VGTDFVFAVTGNDRKLSAEDRSIKPANVRLTGFLSEPDYWRLMQDSHAVLDLTLMPDCLVCGAYEALAAERPMILSDGVASRELFANVACFSQETEQDIGDAVIQMREHYETLSNRMGAEKAAFQTTWAARAANLMSALS